MPRKNKRRRQHPKRQRQFKRSGKDLFRSGLEVAVAEQLHKLKVDFEYETVKVRYLKPPRPSTYTPDFKLVNGIIIETKGRFTASDRYKHILVKEQNPSLDIRFVFSNSKSKLYKGSNTTYADWCKKNGFKFADKEIPKEWLKK